MVFPAERIEKKRYIFAEKRITTIIVKMMTRDVNPEANSLRRKLRLRILDISALYPLK